MIIKTMYICACVAGLRCADVQCLNDNPCQPDRNTFKCVCHHYFIGDFCEQSQYDNTNIRAHSYATHAHFCTHAHLVQRYWSDCARRVFFKLNIAITESSPQVTIMLVFICPSSINNIPFAEKVHTRLYPVCDVFN